MQYKNKKNLYKIVFITILLGFIISLVGCGWFPNGLFGIFDPLALIKVNYTLVNLGEGSISLEIYSMNEVGFNASGFSYEYYYYSGTTKVPIFTKVVEANFYVEPSTSPGTAGAKSNIDNLPLYFQDLLDWLILHPFVTEVNCDLNLIGIDDGLHSLTVQAASNLPVLQPGIDFYPPTAKIEVTPDTTGTAPFTVVFDASGSTDVGSGIASYSWDFGDETTGTGIIENHTYDNSGLYFVTLTVTDFYGNEGNDTVIITVNEPKAPIAVINTVPIDPTGSAPFTVYFDAYESHADPECESGCEIVSYEWDFGDETTGTGVATNHTYDNPGLYIVTLTVTDLNGKEGNDTVAITVNEPKAPIAVITTVPTDPTGSAPFTVYFDAYESAADPECEFGCEIVSYEWDFGDETTGTGVATNHTYDSPGIYIVTLTVTDLNGKEGNDTVAITVNEPKAPIAVITTVPTDPTGSAPFTVYFDAYESAADPECGFGCEIVSYVWDFGDGNLGIGITTNHEYTNIGTYIAILTITDSNGKKGYDSKKIEVEKAPTAVINTTPDPPTGTTPFTVYFDAYESTSESGIVSYSWDFGDGSSGTGITTNHTYINSSDCDLTVTAILTITDSNGYKAYDSVSITIKPVVPCP